jgi:hypothetical protein
VLLDRNRRVTMSLGADGAATILDRPGRVVA